MRGTTDVKDSRMTSQLFDSARVITDVERANSQDTGGRQLIRDILCSTKRLGLWKQGEMPSDVCSQRAQRGKVGEGEQGGGCQDGHIMRTNQISGAENSPMLLPVCSLPIYSNFSTRLSKHLCYASSALSSEKEGSS